MCMLALLPVMVLSCGGGNEEETVAERREVVDESPPNPPAIDPDREEEIRRGTEARQLLARYELLVERIRLDRKNRTYNANVALDNGLVPIAGMHHELLESGLIDTTIHQEISMLAVYILAEHINEDKDPDGARIAARLEKIRAMLPPEAGPDLR